MTSGLLVTSLTKAFLPPLLSLDNYSVRLQQNKIDKTQYFLNALYE